MMKRFALATLLAVLAVNPLTLNGAGAGERSMNAGEMGHTDSDATRMDHAGAHAHDHGSFVFGRPGNASKADRTIRIEALDTMRYDKSKLTVRAGETVRFIVTNVGKIRHELVIGDAAEQHEHAKEMQRMHGMEMHDEANGISLAPGETKTIVWRFDGPGMVELACHEPGHYQAGMISRVSVKR